MSACLRHVVDDSCDHPDRIIRLEGTLDGLGSHIDNLVGDTGDVGYEWDVESTDLSKDDTGSDGERDPTDPLADGERTDLSVEETGVARGVEGCADKGEASTDDVWVENCSSQCSEHVFHFPVLIPKCSLTVQSQNRSPLIPKRVG